MQKWVVKQKSVEEGKDQVGKEQGQDKVVTPGQQPDQITSDDEGWTQVQKRKASKQPQSVFIGNIGPMVEKLNLINFSDLAPSLGFVEG